MTQESAEKIACTLDKNAYIDRLNLIQKLFSRSLLQRRREKDALHLLFDAQAKAEVEALFKMEQACCAFLDISLSESTEGISVVIRVPATAAAQADALLSPFEQERESGMKKEIAIIGGVFAACGICCAIPLSGTVLAGTGIAALIASATEWAQASEFVQCTLPMLGIIALALSGLVFWRYHASRRKTKMTCK